MIAVTSRVKEDILDIVATAPFTRPPIEAKFSLTIPGGGKSVVVVCRVIFDVVVGSDVVGIVVAA